MQEIISFFKDIFTGTDSKTKVGLSQFKTENSPKELTQKVIKPQKEVKLSDLMRKSASC